MLIHDPTHSSITDFAKSVQIVVVNEGQIAIRSSLLTRVRITMYVRIAKTS